jgi:hypothetical protein
VLAHLHRSIHFPTPGAPMGAKLDVVKVGEREDR